MSVEMNWKFDFSLPRKIEKHYYYHYYIETFFYLTFVLSGSHSMNCIDRNLTFLDFKLAKMHFLIIIIYIIIINNVLFS